MKPSTDVQVVLSRYVEGRKRAKALRAEMHGHRCTESYAGSGAIDDPGEARCYQTGEPFSTWCAPCQRRDPLYHELRAQTLANKKALALLEKRAVEAPHKEPHEDGDEEFTDVGRQRVGKFLAAFEKAAFDQGWKAAVTAIRASFGEEPTPPPQERP